MKKILRTVINSKKMRHELTFRNFEAFFALYFADYITSLSAPFHKEMMKLLMKEHINNLVFAGFRGCGKSSIVSVAYAIWSILGKHQKKYILIASQTQRQARQNLQNIKHELENNELLRNDFGPLREIEDEWGSMALISSKYGAKIAAVSTEQSIRGMRHSAHRPQLIICDDIEDLNSVRTQEGRDKTFNWYKGEAFPAGSTDCRYIVVGNVLHADSLVMRLKASIERGTVRGEYRAYPIHDANGKPLWPAKYSAEVIREIEQNIHDPVTFKREYLLRLVASVQQVVRREWIQFYDHIPDKTNPVNRFQTNVSGVDLAISQKESADYTAILKAHVYGSEAGLKIYIDSEVFNKRIPYPSQKKQMEKLFLENNPSEPQTVLIEANSYQAALVQDLRHDGYDVKGITTVGDKRSRLALISPYIQNGTILFAREGNEILIEQLAGFGSEKHDDVVDALISIVSWVKQHYGGYTFSPTKEAPLRNPPGDFSLNRLAEGLFKRYENYRRF